MTAERKLLVLLSGAFVLDHMDRHILSITLNQIGQEFALSDLQLGALSGLAFAVLFAVLSFPVARLTKPGRRKAIAIGALAAWSTLTMLMAAAGGYVQLLLARMGVALGEAGYTPAAHSMVADSFPEKRRASAFALFSAGTNIGLFLAFLLGGFAAAALGWRAAFLMAGLPGLLLSLVLWRYLKEPDTNPTTIAPSRPYAEIWRRLITPRSSRWVLAGATLTALVNYAAITWVATFLIRAHDLRIEQAGLYLAVVGGLGGGAATLFSGVAADRLGARNPAWRLRLIALVIVAAKVLAIAAYAAEDAGIALMLLAFPAMVGGVYLGPTFGHLYSRMPAVDRPGTTAIVIFLLNIVGLGLGPTMVGAFSTSLSTAAAPGAGNLALALGGMQVIGLIGALSFFRAAQLVAREGSGRGETPGA